MAIDFLYTNGVVAVREKYLLADKLVKLCETNAEEALRQLTDSGFGKGAEVDSVYDYEALVAADERAIDEFIREYAPSQAEAVYLLAPRDFHNAKALVKARYLGLDEEKLLAPEGLIPVATIKQCVQEEKYEPLGAELGEAVQTAARLFSESENENALSGAEIGGIFERALYARLLTGCAKNPLLKKLVAAKADMTNILTALRSADAENAAKGYVVGGKLTERTLAGLFNEDTDKAARALDGTPYAAFLQSCLEEKRAGKPMTRAERTLSSYDTDCFSARRYELHKNQPFLYYVFRRRAENEDVRILFVCLLAGMREDEIKKRLRSFR